MQFGPNSFVATVEARIITKKDTQLVVFVTRNFGKSQLNWHKFVDNKVANKLMYCRNAT